MDELKKLLIEECKDKVKNSTLSVDELYHIAVITNIVQSNERQVVSIK